MGLDCLDDVFFDQSKNLVIKTKFTDKINVIFIFYTSNKIIKEYLAFIYFVYYSTNSIVVIKMQYNIGDEKPQTLLLILANFQLPNSKLK